ncbi:hypothetical protein [Streptacidiphilus sp. P02-A3a]|uniref:hypothetical protein n=1 Tax=Streptacidiphilus sp. P02-A3a TaxID=2704468 RepID=UPI0015FD4D82|nr:hypothetical protein [Streptacidiphilus sp. P02-A3a]
MNLIQRHRAVPRTGTARRAVRLGLLATAGLTVVATAATAQAATLSGAAHRVAVADDTVHALANPGHPSRFQDSFTVHQYGELGTASLRNRAEAESWACTADSPCRSVALSFQIVTMAGTDIHLNARNTSHAANHYCAGCQSLAGAWQFIVSTPEPFTLSPAAQRQLAGIHRDLDALGRSTAPIATVQQQADALAAQVVSVLRTAAAAAPERPGTSAMAVPAPTVTVHRMLTG